MRHIDHPCAPVQCVRNATPYTLTTRDHRAVVTVHPGLPAYVQVIHDGLTGEEIDAVLLELSWCIPSPCCVVTLPRHLWEGAMVNEIPQNPYRQDEEESAKGDNVARKRPDQKR